MVENFVEQQLHMAPVKEGDHLVSSTPADFFTTINNSFESNTRVCLKYEYEISLVILMRKYLKPVCH